MKTIDDQPIQQKIKIGSASVGLIGLDIAINTVLTKDISEQDAASFLYDAIRGKNYIPAGSEAAYREALRKEYLRHKNQTASPDSTMVIRILGPACVSCNKIGIMVIEALQKLNIAADVENIHELDEIWRYGVTTTPALIINNQLKSAGRLPMPVEVEDWIKEALE
ncbi:MAG: thioredoxin family protein [Proteobacteria bacterium]|nr:thioredoxin family protein [Pseudomonadota bacterium]MBU1709477.1 thioredoxin family protein [Pseudomonadota bacterium]